MVTERDRLEEARAIVARVLDEIDIACSRFRDDSELMRVNRAGGAWTSVTPLFLDALDAALRASRLTAGTSHPTIGRALRLAGYDRDFDLLRNTPPVRVRVVATPGWQAVEVDPTGARVRVPRESSWTSAQPQRRLRPTAPRRVWRRRFPEACS